MNTFIGPDNYISKSVTYLRCWHKVPDVGCKLWLRDCSWKLPWHFKKHLLQTAIHVKHELRSLNVSTTKWELKVITLASLESIEAKVCQNRACNIKDKHLQIAVLPFQCKYVNCVDSTNLAQHMHPDLAILYRCYFNTY